MILRKSLAALLLTALMTTGCALPQNSSLAHLAPHQPLLEPRTNVLPPAQMLMHPGPGVDGPGPGVMLAGFHHNIGPGGYAPSCAYPIMQAPTSQIGFTAPEGMRVRWDISANGVFDSEPLVVPGATTSRKAPSTD